MDRWGRYNAGQAIVRCMHISNEFRITWSWHPSCSKSLDADLFSISCLLIYILTVLRDRKGPLFTHRNVYFTEVQKSAVSAVSRDEHTVWTRLECILDFSAIKIYASFTPLSYPVKWSLLWS